ncbi:MAG: putative ABC transporter permease [Bacilli bacterium]
MKKKIKETIKKINTYFYENKKKFAKGICFEKLLFLFVIGCIIGTYYEQLLNLAINYANDGSIIWESRRGVIYGPLSPIYGCGFIIMIYFLAHKKLKWYQILLRGSLIGGIFEYLVSFLQEVFVGTVSWDYSTYFLNINGRTTIPYMFFWGIASVLLIKKIYPFFSKLIEKIPYNLGDLITKILIIILSFDMLISWSALIRQDLRRRNVPAYTIVDKFYDKYYPDTYLKKFFPNMRVREVK